MHRNQGDSHTIRFVRLSILLLIILGAGRAWGQELGSDQIAINEVLKPLNADSSEARKIHLEDIEISILGSYYRQDGIHSPVTGGTGTELLDNTAPSISINVPLDSVKSISFSGGVDYYTSASSDNIDNPFLLNNVVTGASAEDTRTYGTLGYKRKNLEKKSDYGLTFGASLEHDVASLQAGASWSKSSKDYNKSYSLKGTYIWDHWSLIYPVELRNGEVKFHDTNIRHSFNVSNTANFVLTPRIQTSVIVDLVYQQGLLATPFHRVYFEGQDLAVVEQLPSSRFKVPLGLRLNYSINDYLILRGHYRFYWDSWDLIGNTIKLEMPIKVSQSLRLYPFYRFHTQNGSKYFAPYQVHTGAEQFYTSDFDLSTLTSHKYGLGISYNPLYGVARFGNEKRVTVLEAINFRFAHYDRSDGLKANVGTLELKFALKRR
jgi:hypothetical protein